jgi:hypothetical protein
VTSDIPKIAISREHRQAVTDAQLSKDSIDRSDLYACPTTVIAQLGGIDVIPPVRCQERQCGKSAYYLGSRFGTLESL